jgi:hypothetical protein
MTKISFDVDFSQDPEKILQEIQKRAEAEVAKREAKDKEANYLSKLHELVNKEIGSDFKNINALIRALTKYASPSVRDKIVSTSPSGRRKTVSMDKDIYDQIKSSLSAPNPNKAAIARETGVSVVQVRKVADGGYDKKFGGETSDGHPSPAPAPEPVVEDLPPPSLPPINQDPTPADEPSLSSLPPIENEIEESPTLPPVSESTDTPLEEESLETPTLDLPPPPSFGEDTTEPAPFPPLPGSADETPEPLSELPPPPSFGEETSSIEEETGTLPPPPSEEFVPVEDNNLPPLPEAAPVEELPLPSSELPPPPSFGEVGEPAEDLPPPPPAPIPLDGIQEEVPPAPPSPDFTIEEEAPAAIADEVPPAPPSEAPSPPIMDTTAPTAPPAPASPPKPSLSGKPSLSLKKGKSKTKGLKLTRPPLKKKLPPSS